MTFKAVLILCAQALIFKAEAQCIGNVGNLGYANGLALAPAAIAPSAVLSSCGAAIAPGLITPAALAPAVTVSGLGLGPISSAVFEVTSASPLAPTGLSVVSENAIEGALAVAGQTPFLAAVALEGAVPNAGAGVVSSSWGNGITEILAEELSPAILPAGLGLGNAGLGYSLSGAGLGLNGLAAAELGLNAVGVNTLGVNALGVNALGVNSLAGLGCNGLGLAGAGNLGLAALDVSSALNGCGCGRLY